MSQNIKKDSSILKENSFKVEQLCNLLNDPHVELHTKVSEVLLLPYKINISEINYSDCNKLFTEFPLEIIECILNSNVDEFKCAKPIVVQIISICYHFNFSELSKKFKPIIVDIVNILSIYSEIDSSTVSDVVFILFSTNLEAEEIWLLYDSLRHIIEFYISQKEQLEVNSFLYAVRLILTKINSITDTEKKPLSVDSKEWSVRILSILFILIKEKTEKIESSIRIQLWDVIDLITRLIGSEWFFLNEQFAQAIVQMNNVEINMTLQNHEKIDASTFSKHLRILENFVRYINNDGELKSFSNPNGFFLAVGDGIKYVFNFWYEMDDSNIELSHEIKTSLFGFSVFLFCCDEFEIMEKKVQMKIGKMLIRQANQILDFSKTEEISEKMLLFSSFFENIWKVKILDDQLAEVLAKFLIKLENGIDESSWKLVCSEMSVNIKKLENRVDWYCSETINNSLKHFDTLSDKDKLNVEDTINFYKMLLQTSK